MRLSKAIDGYLLFAKTKYAAATVEHYQGTLKMVLEHLGDREVDDISAEDLQRYFVFLNSEYKPHRFLPHGATPTLMTKAGVEAYWKALRSFYKWAEVFLGSRRPDKVIPQPKYMLAEVQAFSPDEMKRLIYSAEWASERKPADRKAYRSRKPQYKRNLALLKLMLDTGLRIGEITRLRVRDVDLESGSVFVMPFGTGQKTKSRTVFLGKSARLSMWLYLSDREREDDDTLFSTSVRTLRSLIRSIGEEAQVRNCHPHRFRHTFAIEYLRKSRDPFSLMRLLGHSNLEMSNHYLEILQSDLKEFHKTGSPIDNNKL